MGKTHEYSNDDITVLWKPDLCIHSGICYRGLPEVFKPKERPWIKVEASTSERIASQVKKCPSGALSLKSEQESPESERHGETIQIQILENGPLVVSGKLEISKADGSKENKEERTSFCRCGSSSNKPYCDGSHVSSRFIG
ncbi:Uncharacterized Fe-S cluster protein YjdI [Flavobacteriaceae bacterium MAR_2010_188]|nr:Uncharacterized Fe-S cluster protein YjdI [Flavobacteriaceae bacterium MAR_2010_188]